MRGVKGCGTFDGNVRALPRRPIGPAFVALGKELRSIRQEHKLTVGDVAKFLGCCIVRVSDLERGDETDPRFMWCPQCYAQRSCKRCDNRGYVEKGENNEL